jgi:hypothetical protein
LVSTQRHTSSIGKILGGKSVTTEKLDERATGRSSHLRILFSSFSDLKPGDYTLRVAVTDHRGRVRADTSDFQVVNRPDGAAPRR